MSENTQLPDKQLDNSIKSSQHAADSPADSEVIDIESKKKIEDHLKLQSSAEQRHEQNQHSQQQLKQQQHEQLERDAFQKGNAQEHQQGNSQR